MDDLTRCLYEFVCEKRMGRLSEDKEYIEAVLGAERQQKRMTAWLTEEQRVELDVLTAMIAAQGDITGEHLFQAALGLSRELNALVRG